MVGAGEQKTGSAGNGVVFADYQTVVVDGILVQHVVPPEQAGVVYKIVIYGIVAGYNARAGGDVF